MTVSLECNARTYDTYEQKVRDKSLCNNVQTMEEKDIEAASKAEVQTAINDRNHQSCSRSLRSGVLS